MSYLITQNRELQDRVRSLEQETNRLRTESQLLKIELNQSLQEMYKKIDKVEKLEFTIDEKGEVIAKGNPKAIIEILAMANKLGLNVKDYKIKK